jgi:hypothetical protein
VYMSKLAHCSYFKQTYLGSCGYNLLSCGAALTHVSGGPVMSGGPQHALRQQAQVIRRKVRLRKVADLIR